MPSAGMIQIDSVIRAALPEEEARALRICLQRINHAGWLLQEGLDTLGYRLSAYLQEEDRDGAALKAALDDLVADLERTSHLRSELEKSRSQIQELSTAYFIGRPPSSQPEPETKPADEEIPF